MSELDFSKVGLKMKQLRVEQGYTQEMVAEDLDCTVATSISFSSVEMSRTPSSAHLISSAVDSSA